jgi:translation initiation factor 2B subunit (eIF-2B alpha/beta/delta family)
MYILSYADKIVLRRQQAERIAQAEHYRLAQLATAENTSKTRSSMRALWQRIMRQIKRADRHPTVQQASRRLGYR